jgi:hypothetical protein
LEGGVQSILVGTGVAARDTGDDASESDDGNETTSVDELVGHGGRLAVGNTRPGDRAKLGGRGDDGGNGNKFEDGDNPVDSGEFEDLESGLGDRADESGESAGLGRFDG